jgi:hypothetical protein
MVPSALSTAEPLAAVPTAVTVSASPSTSPSLASTFSVAAVSSSVARLSSVATGAWLTILVAGSKSPLILATSSPLTVRIWDLGS